MNLNKSIIVFSLTFLVLSIIGGFQNFSYIPIADSWHKYELINNVFNKNEYFSLFDIHMEHRILFTRILLILDYYFFGDTQVFLIVTNYLLNFVCFYIIYNFFINKYDLSEYLRKIYFFVFVAFSFYWSQRANLTWEFQSQFYLFLIFSLLTFQGLSSRKSVYLICFYILCSIFTMANGLLVGPLVSFYYLVNKNIKNFFISSAFVLFLILIYFINYEINKDLPSPLSAILDSPLEVARFQLAFLGNIYSFFVGKGIFGLCVSICFGLVSLFLIFHKRHVVIKEPFYLFLLFIIFSSILIAISRYHHSILQPISSRYTTPIIFYWLLIYVLYFEELRSFYNKNKKLAHQFIFVFMFLTIHYQLGALKDNSLKTLERFIHFGLAINNIENFIPHMSDELIQYNLDLDYGFFKRKDVKELRFDENYDENLSECLSELKNLKIDNKENFQSISFYSDDLLNIGNINNYIIMKILDSTNKQVGIYSHNQKFLNNKLNMHFNKKIFFYGFIDSKAKHNQPYKLINSDDNCYWSINL